MDINDHLYIYRNGAEEVISSAHNRQSVRPVLRD
nr:MAG TPA: hypothetical protein [Bacteriophage sp.]